MPLATAADEWLRLTAILAERDTKTPATEPYVSINGAYQTMLARFQKRYPTYEARTTLSYDLGTATPTSGFLAAPTGTTGQNSTPNALPVAAQHQTVLYGGGSSSTAFSVPLASLATGRWQITWYFIEDAGFTTGQRKFNIYANGELYAENVDIYSRVGANTVGSIVFILDAPTSGGITFTATATADNASCTALVCVPVDNSYTLSTPVVPTGGGGGTPVPTDPTMTTVIPRSSDQWIEQAGVHHHPTYFGTPDADRFTEVVAKFADIGLRHVRSEFPALGVDYAWSHVGVLGQSGIKTQYVNDPRNFDGSDSIRANEAINARDKAIAFGVTGYLSAVEGPNEWDLGSAGLWAQIRTEQLKIWQAWKGNAATSGIKIVAPSIGSWPTTARYQQLGNLLSPTQMADWACVHNYFGDTMPNDSQINQAVTLAGLIAPGAPIVTSETGYASPPGGSGEPPGNWFRSDLAQGILLLRVLAEQFRRSEWARTFIYMGVDKSTSSGAWENVLGIIRSDLTYKSAATWLKRLIALYADPGPAYVPSANDAIVYKLVGADANTRHYWTKKRSGLYQLTIWQQTEVQAHGNYTLLNPADVSVQVVLGNSKLANWDWYQPSVGSTPVQSSTGAPSSTRASSEYLQVVNVQLTN